MGAKRILALGSVAALCAGAAAPLFMASAASALDTSNANTICVNFSGTHVNGVNLPLGLTFLPAVVDTPGSALAAAVNAFVGHTPATDGFNSLTAGQQAAATPFIQAAIGASGVGGPVAGSCNIFFGDVQLIVTGPMGGTGPQGPAGATGPAGGQGGTGAVGNHGLKGVQGPTGGTGAPGGTGAAGNPGPAGPTGPDGNSLTGPTGGTGGPGDSGIPGPQGPSGAQGVTGATGAAVPGTIFPGKAPGAGTILPAGPGKVGNTITFAGTSQIILTCPVATMTVLSGGANLLPADVSPGQAVRGILESSFPNPGNQTAPGLQQWIITAEVTQTSVNTNPGPPPAGPALIVDPYVICR